MRKLFQSLRWKLQLWYGLLLLLIISGLLFSFYTLQRDQAYARTDRQLQRWSPRLANAFHLSFRPSPGDPQEQQNQAWLQEINLPPDLEGQFSADGDTQAYYSVWDSNGNLVTFSESAPTSVPYPDHLRGSNHFRTRDQLREFSHLLPEGTMLLVGLPLNTLETDLRALTFRLSCIGAAILVFGLAGGWWFISTSLRPIEAMRQTSQTISQGDLSARIKIEDEGTELGKLSSTLNHTFARLEDSFAQQIRFTADASHELRTPLSIIRSKAQLALSRPRSSEEYQEAIRICQKAAERMGELVESLLRLARIDSGEASSDSADFQILPVIEESVDLIEPLAEEAKIEIETPTADHTVRGNPVWTQQVLTNLLANAIHYCPESKLIRIVIDESPSELRVTVMDFGPGIDEQDLKHIFDRFYRVDKARSRREGGSGLGLSICRALMEAQNGSITAKSRLGKGSQFTIHLLRKLSSEDPENQSAKG